MVDEVIEDGVISPDEKQTLQETKKALGLKLADAETILDNSREKRKVKETVNISQQHINNDQVITINTNQQCPHCGNKIDIEIKKI